MVLLPVSGSRVWRCLKEGGNSHLIFLLTSRLLMVYSRLLMGKRLLTEADLKRMVKHNTLELSGKEMLTPQAKDLLSKLQRSRESGMTIAIGADHRGFRLKEVIKPMLNEQGLKVIDVGSFGEACCDYPDFAKKVAHCVSAGECEFGIMINGKGNGSAITCNKVRGIRAALCHDTVSARSAREHNDANILTLGADQIGDGLALEVVSQFLTTQFAGGRHKRRLEKISLIEKHQKA